MTTYLEGREYHMEKRVMGIFGRTCLVLIAFACAAITANANVLNNPGFEFGQTTNTIFQDTQGNIVTNREPLLWSVNNFGFRTMTNSPVGGTYQDPDYWFLHSYSGINSSAAPITALSGKFSARIIGPFEPAAPTLASLFQVVTNQVGQLVSNTQVWVINGYGLNWSGDPLTNIDGVLESENFGILQLEFFNAAGVSLGTSPDSSPKILTNTLLDTWISCSATGTAPLGTTYIRAHAAHVGKQGALGSVFWDDIDVTNIGFATPPTPVPLEPAGIQLGVQVCWPTLVDSSYQPQYSDDNATWVNIISSNAAQQLLPGDGLTNCTFSTIHKFYRVLRQPGTVTSLPNPGFETAGVPYVYAGVTNTSADSWTQFNYGFRSGTNESGFGITARNDSGFSLKTFGPYTNYLEGSGAYQDLTASAGQNWRLTGYCLNWQNDKLTGSNGFGVAQLQFLDSTNGVIFTAEGSRFGTDVPFPLDTWQFFEVEATNAPSGTVKVRAQVLHVGMAGDNGAVYWDDLTIYQPIGGSSATTSTNQPAVQIYWPTAPPSNGVLYQVQSITNLVFITPPIVGNVLTNEGFEADAVSNAADTTTITMWNTGGSGAKYTSSYPYPTHSGIGALKLRDTTAGANPPVAWQGAFGALNPVPATPGQVWDFSGYAYNYLDDQPLTGPSFGVLKIVWNDSLGNSIQVQSTDPNRIGTRVTGTYPGIESTHITSSSLNSWVRLQARGTAPAGTAYVQVLPIVVGTGGPCSVRFDDVALTTNLYSFGWQSLGPVYPGHGNTNQVFDPIGSNTRKFYRVTTP